MSDPEIRLVLEQIDGLKLWLNAKFEHFQTINLSQEARIEDHEARLRSCEVTDSASNAKMGIVGAGAGILTGIGAAVLTRWLGG